MFFCTETIKYQGVKSTSRAEMVPNWAGCGSYSSKWSADTFSGIMSEVTFQLQWFTMVSGAQEEDDAHKSAWRELNLNCFWGRCGVMSAPPREHHFSLTAKMSVSQLQVAVPPKGVLGMVRGRPWSILYSWGNSQLPLTADCIQAFQGRGLCIYIRSQ